MKVLCLHITSFFQWTMDETNVDPVWEGLLSLALLYFPDFFFFFLVKRYQKTRVSHLQLIAFLVFHQESKLCCTDSFHVVTWGKKQFSLQLVKSDSGPQSALCYLTPCPWAQLLWLNQAHAKMSKVAGKKGEGQEPLPHLSALQEQSFCGYT